MRTFSLLAVLLLLVGCNNTQKAPSESQTNEPAANTSVPAQASDTAPVETASAETPAMAAPVASTAPAASVASPVPSATAAPSAPTAAKEEVTAEISPAILFQKCAACHGNHAEKSALNQSAVIGEWDSKRIAAAIVGYQEGTYGGAMKTLMQNQVKGLNRVDIEALSEYIANLYVKTH